MKESRIRKVLHINSMAFSYSVDLSEQPEPETTRLTNRQRKWKRSDLQTQFRDLLFVGSRQTRSNNNGDPVPSAVTRYDPRTAGHRRKKSRPRIRSEGPYALSTLSRRSRRVRRTSFRAIKRSLPCRNSRRKNLIEIRRAPSHHRR